MKNDEVTLLVNNAVYAGWVSVTIQSSIEAIAAGFQLSLTDRWSPYSKPWPVMAGDACILKIGPDKVIDGFINEYVPSFSKTEHSIMASGRSKAGDLVDCSVRDARWEFRGQRIETIIASIISPFGLKVITKCDTGKVFDKETKDALQPGEKCFDVIDQLCKMRGVLPISDASGNIVLVRAGNEYVDTDLVFGKNIEYCRGNFSDNNRYSSYTVLGQHSGSNEFFGEAANQIEGKATDSNVKRYRPITILAERMVTRPLALRRAAWEAAVRAGKSGMIVVGVTGWRTAGGSLWTINKMVDVYIPALQLENEPLLIQSVTLSKSKAGTFTELSLCRPDAYLPEPWEAKATKKDDFWSDVKQEIAKK